VPDEVISAAAEVLEPRQRPVRIALPVDLRLPGTTAHCGKGE